MKKIMKRLFLLFSVLQQRYSANPDAEQKALVGEETTQTAAGETGKKKWKAEGETIHLKIATCGNA